jgi:hypothetical protein
MDRGQTLTIIGLMTLIFPMLTWQTFVIPLLFLLFGIGFIVYDRLKI